MNISKTSNGNILITDIANNQLVKQQYNGYSIKDCKQKFKLYLKSLLD